MNKFKEARTKRGLGQKEVAYKLGVTQPTISDWESGRKTPTLDNIKALAKLYGVSLDYLVNETNYTDTPDPLDKEKSPLDKELEGVDFALYGEARDLTEEEKQDILDFIKFKKSQRK